MFYDHCCAVSLIPHRYGLVKKRKDALKVKIPGVGNGKSGPLQIIGKNGDQTYPNLGGIVGYWNTNDALTANSKQCVVATRALC